MTDTRDIAINELMRQLDERDALLRESRRKHYYCEDCWYSCVAIGEDYPEETCCDEERAARNGGHCDCGAAEWNKRVDDLVGPDPLLGRYEAEK